jgi:hypothetical protein
VTAESVEMNNNINTPNEETKDKKRKIDNKKMQNENDFIEVGNVNGLSTITFEFGLSEKGIESSSHSSSSSPLLLSCLYCIDIFVKRIRDIASNITRQTESPQIAEANSTNPS